MIISYKNYKESPETSATPRTVALASVDQVHQSDIFDAKYISYVIRQQDLEYLLSGPLAGMTRPLPAWTVGTGQGRPKSYQTGIKLSSMPSGYG
jgi:hypothetical protein